MKVLPQGVIMIDGDRSSRSLRARRRVLCRKNFAYPDCITIEQIGRTPGSCVQISDQRITLTRERAEELLLALDLVLSEGR